MRRKTLRFPIAVFALAAATAHVATCVVANTNDTSPESLQDTARSDPASPQARTLTSETRLDSQQHADHRCGG